MVKIFMTGDNHFGRKYDRFPDIKEKLLQSRFDSFEAMVHKAEAEGCELFVVTGDLFENTNTIKVSDVKKIVEILAAFVGTVLILPGNHDYYTGNEKVWKDFSDAASSSSNIIILNEFKEYTYEAGEETVVVYPAYCQSKHSKENNLGWIKNSDIKCEGQINIGIAHGAIMGVTPDKKEEYFLMTEEELNKIPVDVWMIGHTHIAYPGDLKEDVDTAGYKIFNAGTHEQTDLHNNTEGDAFIITIDKQDMETKVLARKFVSGKVRFYDLKACVKPDSEASLSKALLEVTSDLNLNSVVRVTVSGTIKQSEYEDKDKIYKDVLGKFLSFETRDDELSEEITVEKIRTEYAETSFAAKFLEELTNNPIELQMAYKLIQNCKEN